MVNMKILLVSYSNPLGKGGFEKQAMGLITNLVSQGHEIACLTTANPKDVVKVKSDLDNSGIFTLGSEVISHQDRGYSKLAQLFFWLNQHPAKFLGKKKPQLCENFKTYLQTIIKDKKIDLVHVLSLRTTYYLPEEMNIPTIIDLVDSMGLRRQRALEALPKKSSIKQKLSSWLELEKTKKIEQDILKRYGKYCPFVTISPVDKSYLLNLHSSALVEVATAGINLNWQNQNLELKPNFSKTIIFYGFIQEHNLDALLYLINDIIPVVLKVHPDLQLKVTGFNLPQKIFDLSKNLNWLSAESSVENIEDFILSASLTCWPFRLGCGVKTKILECMAYGKPVITTTIGAEALTETQKEGILTGDSTEEIAHHIINLFNNPDECLRLGQINHKIAISEFTWEKKAQDYQKIYKLAQDQFKH